MKALLAGFVLMLMANPALAQDAMDSVTVGPWKIATTREAGEFRNCTMSRSTSDVNITVERNPDGLVLVLDSEKWKLERGKAYSVRLIAGSRSVEAKALAESRSVTIALADRMFNAKLNSANVLEVRGEGASIRVPLDGSAAGLKRLEECFKKNSGAGTDRNPFVMPTQTP